MQGAAHRIRSGHARKAGYGEAVCLDLGSSVVRPVRARWKPPMSAQFTRGDPQVQRLWGADLAPSGTHSHAGHNDRAARPGEGSCGRGNEDAGCRPSEPRAPNLCTILQARRTGRPPECNPGRLVPMRTGRPGPRDSIASGRRKALAGPAGETAPRRPPRAG